MDDRLEKMEYMLHEMMKVENTAAGKISHKTPTIANVKGAYKLNVSVLGAYKSRLRGEIEEAIQIKAESLIDLVDDLDLLAHR